MSQKAGKVENINSDLGEIVLYPSEDRQAALDVHLQNETVWLTQKQIASLFETERSVVTKHINNIFRSEELDKKAVCAKFAHTAGDGKTYQTNYYNLDVIIAVGYRVNAKRGTQFRIWATTILKDHLVRGYSLNQRRLAEKGVEEVRQVLSLLQAPWKVTTLSAMKVWSSWKLSTAMQEHGSFFCNMMKTTCRFRRQNMLPDPA